MQIAPHMIFTPVMKNTFFGSFYYRAKRFSGIVVNGPACILLFAMIHRLVGGKSLPYLLVRFQLIGHQMSALVYKSFNHWLQSGNAITVDWHCPRWALSLYGHKHTLFVGAFAPFMNGSILISGLTSDIFFVKRNDSLQRRVKFIARFHHFSNRMAKLPGAFLGDAYQFTEVDRRDSLTGIDDQEHGQQPFPQLQLCAVHRRVAGDGKLPLTLATFVSPGRTQSPFKE
jgi:hypothetical protein